MRQSEYTYTSDLPLCTNEYLYPVVERLLSNVPNGASVLDIGCGNGTFLHKFANKGWACYGADFSVSGIEFARRLFPAAKFFVENASSPSGEVLKTVGQVDAVMSTEVIEHLYDPRGFLKNAYDLLKPGGTFVVSTPYHGYLKNVVLAVSGNMDKHFTVLWDHGHIKFWSKQTLTTALEEAGFRDISFHGAGRLPLLWKSMVLKATKPL
jgi:2-polyprenyl-3-methyl-5-hydroxy-6-metoxy-1,4-benzoquinol methylase